MYSYMYMYIRSYRAGDPPKLYIHYHIINTTAAMDCMHVSQFDSTILTDKMHCIQCIVMYVK